MAEKSLHSICKWTFNPGKGGFVPGDMRPEWGGGFGTPEMIELVAKKIRPRLPDNIELGIEMHYDAEVDDDNAAAVADALVDNKLHLAMITPGAHNHFAYGRIASSCARCAKQRGNKVPRIPSPDPDDTYVGALKANCGSASGKIGNGRAVVEMQTACATVRVELQEVIGAMPHTKLYGAEEFNNYRSCFFAFDYTVEENFSLLRWLQEYFLKPGLGVRVLAPADRIDNLNIPADLYRKLRSVHFGIAEISGNNSNVLIETGVLKGLDRPVVLLKRRDSKEKVPFDIDGDYRIEYLMEKRAGKTKFVWLQEEMDKAMAAVFEMAPRLREAAKWPQACGA